MGITEMVHKGEPTFTQFSLVDSPKELLSNWFHQSIFPLVTNTSSTIYPLQFLLGQFTNTVGDKYRYFKCDIEAAFVLRTTPLYYGAVVINWYPADFPDEYSARNCDPILLDISTGGTTIVEFPYSSVNESYYVTLANVINGFQTPQPEIILECLYQRGLNASMVTPELQVMFRMVNPVFFGTTTRSGISQMGDRQLLAADRTMVNPYMASAAVVGTSAMVALGNAYHMAGTINSYFKAASITYGEVSKVGENLGNAWNSVSGYFERDKISTDDPRDKRESSQQGEMRNAPTPVGFLPSMTYNVQDSLDPLASFRIKPMHLADSNMCHRILDLCQIPCLNREMLWTAKTQNFDVLLSPLLLWSNTTYGWPYLSLLAQHFRYWRGSFDIDFYFFTSPLISARFVINLTNEGPTSTKPSITANGSFHYLKRINVSGFTRVSVKVPSTFPTAWVPTYPYATTEHTIGTEIVPFRMNMHLESDIVGGGDQSPQVFMLMAISAGDDFQLRSVQGTSIVDHTPEFEVVAQSQSHVRTKAAIYENLARGGNPYKYRPLPEDDMCVEDLCFRWSYRSDAILEPIKEYGSFSSVNDSFDFLVNMFRYVRGSTQAKAVLSVEDGDQKIYLRPPHNSLGTGGNPINAGMYETYLGLNPVMTIELPIIAPTDWIVTSENTKFQNPVPWPIDTSLTSLASYYVRAGRGFQLAFLNPPYSLEDAVVIYVS